MSLLLSDSGVSVPATVTPYCSILANKGLTACAAHHGFFYWKHLAALAGIGLIVYATMLVAHLTLVFLYRLHTGERATDRGRTGRGGFRAAHRFDPR